MDGGMCRKNGFTNNAEGKRECERERERVCACVCVRACMCGVWKQDLARIGRGRDTKVQDTYLSCKVNQPVVVLLWVGTGGHAGRHEQPAPTERKHCNPR